MTVRDDLGVLDERLLGANEDANACSVTLDALTRDVELAALSGEVDDDLMRRYDVAKRDVIDAELAVARAQIELLEFLREQIPAQRNGV